MARPVEPADEKLLATDDTSEFNTHYREGVGFFYDLVQANVDRIVKSLIAELEDEAATALGVTPLAGDEQVPRFAGRVLAPRQLADTNELTETDGSHRSDCRRYIDAYGSKEQSGQNVEQFRRPMPLLRTSRHPTIHGSRR